MLTQMYVPIWHRQATMCWLLISKFILEVDTLCYCYVSPFERVYLTPLVGFPDSKVHEANMGPTWVLSAADGPQVGPMNRAIKVCIHSLHPCSVQEVRCLPYFSRQWCPPLWHGMEYGAHNPIIWPCAVESPNMLSWCLTPTECDVYSKHNATESRPYVINEILSSITVTS